jgi:ribosomal protein L36
LTAGIDIHEPPAPTRVGSRLMAAAKDGAAVMRRKGKTCVSNKLHPRWKARQG